MSQFLQDNQLVGVIGGSGGMNIIPAVIQVFLNHFILGMEPLAAVQNPRVYHKVLVWFRAIDLYIIIELFKLMVGRIYGGKRKT